MSQKLRDLQELVIILNPDHPVLREDRIVAGIGTRQRCSMRACSPLCCELCHFEKFIGLFEAFDKTSNYPSIRIFQQIAGEIRKVEVCLVPCLPTV